MKRVIDEKTLKALYPPMETAFEAQMRQTLRSLNLSNSVAIAAYEVLRQWNYPDLSTEGNLTQYSWDTE